MASAPPSVLWVPISAVLRPGGVSAADRLAALHLAAAFGSGLSGAVLQTLREVGLDRPGVLEAAHAECQRLYGAIAARYHAGVKAADERFSVTMAELSGAKNKELLEADQTYQPRLATLTQQGLFSVLAETEIKYPAQLAELNDGLARELLCAVRPRHRGEPPNLSAALGRNDRALAVRVWSNSNRPLEEIQRQKVARSLADNSSGISNNASNADSSAADRAWHWTPPAELRAICFGQGEVRLARLEGGLPKDERCCRRRPISPCRCCSPSRGIRCCS